MGNLGRDASAGEQLNLYAYAGNNPVVRTDPNGRFFDVVVDAVSVAAGMAAIAAWGEKTSTLDKALDVGGLVADVAAAAIPFVPGGASRIRQVATKADDLVDASRALGNVDNAKDAASAASKGADAAKGSEKAADAGKAGDAAKRAGGASEAGKKADAAGAGTRVEKTGSGKRVGDFTAGQKTQAKAENARMNEGKMACSDCKRQVQNVKSEKGVRTPKDQAQVHHNPPISEGGGKRSKPEVLCPECHVKKHTDGK